MEPKWEGAPEKSQEKPSFAMVSFTATKELGNLLQYAEKLVYWQCKHW